MLEQTARIPDIDPTQMEPQSVQVVDQSYITERALHNETDRAVSPWLKRFNSYQRLQELGAPEFIIGRSRTLLSKEKLTPIVEEYFDKPGVAQAFDRLITNYATQTGELDELVKRFKPEQLSNLAKKILLDVLGIEGDHADDQPGAYRFSDILRGKGDDITDDTIFSLVELHSESLVAAQERLDAKLPGLKERFYSGAEKMKVGGLLPAGVMSFSPGNEPSGDEEERLSRLEVIVSDPVVNVINDRGGHYDAAENAIYIDADRVFNPDGKRELEEVFTHEMFHAHSGLTVVLDGDEWFDMIDESDANEETAGAWVDLGGKADITKLYKRNIDEVDHVLEARKVGLRSKNNIINEAYTERATMMLTGKAYDDKALWADYMKLLDDVTFLNTGIRGRASLYEKYGDIYLPNRVIMAGLVAYGLDPLLMGEAYFESYEPKRNNPDRKPGQTLPANRALDAAIAQVTPYKSLEQLQKRIWVEARKRWPKLRSVGDFAWDQALVLEETLRNGSEAPLPSR